MNKRLLFFGGAGALLILAAGLLFALPPRFWRVADLGQIAPCGGAYDYVLRGSFESGEAARFVAEALAAGYARRAPAALWQPVLSARPLPPESGAAGELFQIGLGPEPENYLEVHSAYGYLSPAAAYVSVQIIPTWSLLAFEARDPRVYIMLWRANAPAQRAADEQARAVPEILESAGAAACLFTGG